MEKIAALKLDFKDEPEFLKTLYPSVEDIPNFIKSASADEAEDHEYALILEDSGFEFKKFATHDAGNTALSIMYFLKNHNVLSEDAIKIASDNLIYAAGRYKLKVPEQLKELAKDLTDKGIPVITREKHWMPIDNLKPIDDLSSGKVERNLVDKPKTKLDVLNNGLEKKANSITMPKDIKPMAYNRSIEKVAMLLDKYPVKDAVQAKMADDYFNEYWRDFEPADRQEYCTKLASLMTKFFIKPSEKVAEYSHSQYSPHLLQDLNLRKNFLEEDMHEVIDIIGSNKDQVKPETLASALTDFDKMAGLDKFWDSRIKDPYATVFGPSEKTANDWNYNEAGAYISESDLRILANTRIGNIRKQFGDDFAFKFKKEPKKMFQSLDKDMKLLLARMCADNS